MIRPATKPREPPGSGPRDSPYEPWSASGAVVRASRAVARLPRRAALAALAVYRLGISPWLPSACRHWPTCSAYAREAVERFGLLRGGGLAARRLLRCHPFSRGGFDPVPPADARGRPLRRAGRSSSS